MVKVINRLHPWKPYHPSKKPHMGWGSSCVIILFTKRCRLWIMIRLKVMIRSLETMSTLYFADYGPFIDPVIDLISASLAFKRRPGGDGLPDKHGAAQKLARPPVPPRHTRNLTTAWPWSLREKSMYSPPLLHNMLTRTCSRIYRRKKIYR